MKLQIDCDNASKRIEFYYVLVLSLVDSYILERRPNYSYLMEKKLKLMWPYLSQFTKQESDFVQ